MKWGIDFHGLHASISGTDSRVLWSPPLARSSALMFCLFAQNACSGGALSPTSPAESVSRPTALENAATVNPLASPGAPSLSSTVQAPGAALPAKRFAKSAANNGAPDGLLFFDDFEDQNAAKWAPAAGNWHVCRPYNTWEYCASPIGELDTFAGDGAWKDYSVSAYVHVDAFTPGRNGIDLVARAQDVNHFYEVEFVNERGTQQWELWKKDGPSTWLNLARGPIVFAAGSTFLLELDANGPNITVSMSRDRGATFTRLGSASDSRYPAGKIGLRAWGGMTGSFDSVTVAPDIVAARTSAANAVSYDGCNIFPPDDKVYNTDYYGAGIDPNSSAIIESQTNVDSSTFDRETYFGSEKVNLDERDVAPKYRITGNASYHPAGANNNAKWPWANGYFIQPGLADSHSMVLDTYGKPNHCYIYEAYKTTFQSPNGPLSWSSGVFWNLGQYYQPPVRMAYRGAGWGAVNAIGDSMFAGGVKLDEVVAGPVKHALNIAVLAHSLLPGASTEAVRYPAEIGESYSYAGSVTAHEMPYGAHLRLKSSFNAGVCSTPGSQAYNIVFALRHFGGYVSDTGSDGNGIYLWDSNGSNTWDQTGILNCLRSIHMTDFDVLPPPALNPAIPLPDPNPTPD